MEIFGDIYVVSIVFFIWLYGLFGFVLLNNSWLLRDDNFFLWCFFIDLFNRRRIISKIMEKMLVIMVRILFLFFVKKIYDL